jgi:hypothetical protein
VGKTSVPLPITALVSHYWQRNPADKDGFLLWSSNFFKRRTSLPQRWVR